MATKRVSWELKVGDLALYFLVRKQAVAQAREERAQGHAVEMNRWEWIGDEQPTSAPVDLDALIAEAEAAEAREEQAIQAALNAPLPPLPKRFWREVAQALSV